MADDYFERELAWDPTAAAPLPEAVAQVFAIVDTSFSTPLTITEPSGIAYVDNQLVADVHGFYPQFVVASGETVVNVKSGDLVTRVTSVLGKQGAPGEPGPPVDPTGSTPGQVYTSQGSTEAPIWADPVGGAGSAGREVQIQKSATHIQWRYVGDDAWTDIIALSALAGTPGTPGAPGQSPQLRVSGGYLQWKLPADTTWQNLIELSTLGGGGAGIGTVVALTNPAGARNHPVTGNALPAPPACVVWWYTDTAPVNFVSGDVWITPAT